MNSSFVVSDLGGFSPLDFGEPVVTRLTSAAAPGRAGSAAARRRSAGVGAAEQQRRKEAPEEFKVVVQPTVSNVYCSTIVSTEESFVLLY